MKYMFIGDVHGCFEELRLLLEASGYAIEYDNNNSKWVLSGGDGRRVVFLGDICDRGPLNEECFTVVYNLWKTGQVDWVMGNHDYKLFRWMVGNEVKMGHGIEGTIKEIEELYSKEKLAIIGQDLLDNLPSVMIFDEGKVIAAHAYPEPRYLGRKAKKATKAFYGPNDDGHRVSWWDAYKQDTYAVFGHYWLNDPTPRDHWCCVDTSCCRGGQLSALMWPEKEVVQQQALAVYDDTVVRDSPFIEPNEVNAPICFYSKELV